MGPYCKFCNNRCFVHIPEGTPQEAIDAYGINTIVATCQGGQAFEKQRIGWNYDRIMQAIDGLDAEGQAAWNAYQASVATEPTWEERERMADQERLAYCGYED
jgi:hypothetical protein